MAGPDGVAAAKYGGGTVQFGKRETRSTQCAGVEDAALDEVVDRLTSWVVKVRQQCAAVTNG